jgi:signal transduction histidine kinase
MALLLRDEATVEKILRENNRFNNTLALIAKAAVPEEQDVIQRIQVAQGEALTAVADIANLLRDGKVNEAMNLQQSKGYPLYEQIAGLVDQVVLAEQSKMTGLRANVAAATQTTRNLLGAFVLASIVLALLLGFVISWSFIVPVREAHRFVNEVAKGNFQATINVANRDEFGVLANRMNQMSRDLHDLYEKQRAATEELQRLNQRLTEASNAKSEFLANMSHELRTPLNAIIGYTELILDSTYGEVPERVRGTLARVERSGRMLLALINEVLDLSKIEAGQLKLDVGAFALADTIGATITSLESLAREKGLKLHAQTPEGLPKAIGDERRIMQVLVNLVGNAIKFTDAGEVEVQAALDGDRFVVTVRDTGPGIAPEYRARIFHEFQQADTSTTRPKEGAGLGLAISKRIVEMHGGSLSLMQSEVGRGSTFGFTLPGAGPPAPAPNQSAIMQKS